MRGTGDGDPARWRADPARRSRGAELLLRGARRPQLPGDGTLERLGTLVDDIPRLSAARARRGARMAAAAAAGVTLVALATGVWAWRGQRRAPPAPSAAGAAGLTVATAPAPATRRAIEAPPAPDVVVAEAAPAPRPVAPHAPSRRAHAARAVVETGPSNADALAREIALVDAARGDLAGAPARALVALDAHRREFPRGQLAAEREFLAVEALRRMNRLAEARARAAELEARYPSSSYASRAARLLQAP
jgi:hypothetical protein